MPHIYAHRSAVPKTMRALAKIDPVPGLKLIEALVPVPGPGEVLVRVKKTALSYAALHIDRWDAWAQRAIRPPVIVGHEFAGLVASIGPGVADFHPGETVVAEPHVACGTCRHCLSGRRHLCRDARRLGQTQDGVFADYVCLPQGCLWHADPRVPIDVLACFIPLGQAVRVARRFDLLGANVLVTGANALGCMTAAIAHHAGARSVVVADANPAGLALARSLGTTHTVDTRSQTLDLVCRELGIGEGFDLGVEAAGLPAALGDLLAHLRPGGQLALLGAETGEVAVDVHAILSNQLTVAGIDDRNSASDWERLTQVLRHGLDLGAVITHRLPVGRFREAFDRIAAGEPGKIILDWDC